jgi:hypothetical protein
MMGCNGTGFAWYGTAGGMGAFFFRFGLHDTLFALRLRYTIEAVHIVCCLEFVFLLLPPCMHDHLHVLKL